MDALFQKVRESCSTQLWSKGVELARKDLVSGLGQSSAETNLRVSGSLGGFSAEVTLYNEDLDWLCTCGSDDDPCVHVAASVIAIKRAEENGQKIPISATVGGRIQYEWVETPPDQSHRDPLLQIKRSVLFPDGRITPLKTAIAAMVAGRVPNPGISATPEDVEIDLHLIQCPLLVYQDSPSFPSPTPQLLSGSQGITSAQQKIMLQLFKALSRLTETIYQGQPIRVIPDVVNIEVLVEDDGPGVRVRGHQDPDILALYAHGIARCRSGLRPFWIPNINSKLRDLLRDGRLFGPRDFGEIVAEILPPLREVVPVLIKTKKLPGAIYGVPLLDLVVTRDPADSQSVFSEVKILYHTSEHGIVASVENGRLVPIDPKIPVPTRDVAQELKLKDEATRRFGREVGQKMVHRGKDAIALVNSLKTNQHLPASDSVNLSSFTLYGTLKPEVAIEDSNTSPHLSIQFKVPQGASKFADPQDVLQAFQQGESLVPLLGGGWAELPKDWLKKYGHQLREMMSHRAMHQSEKASLARIPLAPTSAHEVQTDSTLVVPQSVAFLVDAGQFLRDLGQTPPAAITHAERIQSKLVDPPPALLPEDLKATLRPYQQQGYNWLCCLRDLGQGAGALLCDEMGLGKTLQSIAALKGLCLVVAPASVMPNWQEEIAKFRPHTKVHLYHGPGRSINQTGLSGELEVYLTTFSTLRLDLNRLSQRVWDTVVIDEGQTIKNPQSQIAQASYALKSKFRVVLTGTPVENRLEDLWSQMHFANPGLLGDLTTFRSLYVTPDLSKETLQRLKTRISPYIKRRLKVEVAPDLPARTETVCYVELSPDERSRYDALRLATRDDLLSKLGFGGQAMLALEALLRLRQAACHGHLLPGTQLTTDEATPYPGSSKLAVLLDLLTESIENGHKILVFSQWTGFLKLIGLALDHHQVDYATLTGETTDRMEVVHRFQAPEGPKVMLMSLKAGGVGLNLTAADHVIFIDPWWNPAAEDQAADRAHRIGQERPVLIQRLVTLNTVEERILVLKAAKKDLAARLLDLDGQGANSPGTLTREEILSLLD